MPPRPKKPGMDSAARQAAVAAASIADRMDQSEEEEEEDFNDMYADDDREAEEEDHGADQGDDDEDYEHDDDESSSESEVDEDEFEPESPLRPNKRRRHSRAASIHSSDMEVEADGSESDDGDHHNQQDALNFDSDEEAAAYEDYVNADDQWFEGAEPTQTSAAYQYPLEPSGADDFEEDFDEGSGAEEEVFAGTIVDMPVGVQREPGEKRRTGRYGKTAGKQLPPYIEALIGKANSALVAGDQKQALKQLEEAIRQAPMAPQSYQTLATMAANAGDKKTELEVHMCICGLNKQDQQQYLRTASLAAELGDFEKEDECIRRLCALDPQNVDYVVDRAGILERAGKVQMAAATYRNAIKKAPSKVALYFSMSNLCSRSQLPKLVNMRVDVLAGALAMLLGRDHLKQHLLELAADSWHVSADSAYAAADPHAVFAAAKDLANLLMAGRATRDMKKYASVAADVLLSVDSWVTARRSELLKVIGAGADGSDDDSDSESAAGSGGGGSSSKTAAAAATAAEKAAAVAALRQVAMPLDLVTKLSVCYMHMGELTSAAEGLRPVMRMNPAVEAAGECLAEAGEAYMVTSNFRGAVPVLNKLARSGTPRSSWAHVRLGEALTKLGETKSANDSFLEVLKSWPGHCGALIGYAALHRSKKEQSAAEDALCALEQAITQLVDNILNPEDACLEVVDVPAAEAAAATAAAAASVGTAAAPPAAVNQAALKVLIVAGSWQKLQLLLEWGHLSRVAERPADQLSVLLPALSEALRQIRVGPAMEQRSSHPERRTDKKRPSTIAAAAAAEKQRLALLAATGKALVSGTDAAASAAAPPSHVRVASAGATAGHSSSTKGTSAAGGGGASSTSAGAGDESVEESKGAEPADAAAAAVKTIAAASKKAAAVKQAVWRKEVAELGVSLEWQSEQQRSITEAVFLLSVEQDLQRCLGATRIVNLTRDSTRALVALDGRRADATAVVKAAFRLKDLPVNPEQRKMLQSIATGFAGRNMRFKPRSSGGGSSGSKASARPAAAPGLRFAGTGGGGGSDDEGSDDGYNSYNSDQREWAETRDLTESAMHTEAYRKKVEQLTKNPDSVKHWNDVVHELQLQKGSLHRRTDILMDDFPKAATPWLVKGNAMNASARLKQSIICYATAIDKQPEHSLPYLSLGMALTRVVSSEKRTSDFHECAVKACAVLHRYAELRVAEEAAETEAQATAAAAAARRGAPAPAAVSHLCPTLEALYNIARAYQQLGLMQLAEGYYWRVLKGESAAGAGAEAVKKQAAYNLVRLYEAGGAVGMARHVLATYLTVG